MTKSDSKVCIVGAGGFARETLTCLIDSISGEKHKISEKVVFMVDDENYLEQEIMGIPVIKDSEFKPEIYEVVVAIGNSQLRKKVVEKLPKSTRYTSIIHPTAVISDWVKIGKGSIVTAGTIVTTDIEIGDHCHLNLHTTIGHFCRIGKYFTTSPGVNISGNCKVGECVYLGSNASLRQGIEIVDNVTVGMGGVVVKDLLEEGVYIGNPAKKLLKP